MHTYVMAFGVGFTFEQCGASLACLWVAPSNAPPLPRPCRVDRRRSPVCGSRFARYQRSSTAITQPTRQDCQSTVLLQNGGNGYAFPSCGPGVHNSAFATDRWSGWEG